MMRIPSARWISILFLVLLAGLYVTSQAQEMVASRERLPEIVGTTPTAATPGTEMELTGYRLGWPNIANVRVLFLQNGLEYPVRPTGGGWEAADLLRGRQHMKVLVPDGVQPGPCEILLETNGEGSAAITIEIQPVIEPAQVTGLEPRWAQPGEVIWIRGVGFGIYDEIELIDGQGEVRRFPCNSSSSATAAAFTLPNNLPDGEASLYVVERRSGNEQRSGKLSLMISNGPVPLDVWGSWLTPVAPGQWLDLVITSLKPLERAERAEVAFEQNGKRFIVPIVNYNYPRVHVPSKLTAGEATLATRTWRAGKASPWSEPVSYKLLAQPVPPLVMSLEVVPLAEPIYLGPSAPEMLVVMAGEELILRGKFPVASVTNLSIVLQGKERSFPLTPSVLDPNAMKIQLPAELSPGDWRLNIAGEDGKGSPLPIKLHVE
ncbi:MAG: hypothetical protein AB1489_12230 [Acidobacteriota bacterium]